MNKSIVKGSLSAISKKENKSLAESFMSCDTLLLVDMSASMADEDTPESIPRYEQAERDVIRLQGKYEGKVALVCFSSTVQFCPTGVPVRLMGGTDLLAALKFIKPADDCGIKLILISDGEPHRKDQCLQYASQLKSQIDVVYVGPSDDAYGGQAWLQKFAAATGGQYIQSDNTGELFLPTEQLMLKG